eukprot:PhM_4_TR14401/c0_g1_i1/m.29787
MPAKKAALGKATANSQKKTPTVEKPAEAVVATSSPKKKAVAWRTDAEANVETYVTTNPVNAKGAETFDWSAFDEKENAAIVERRVGQRALSPERCARLSNTQQAFNPFAIPFMIDTNDLTVRELKSELQARGLPVSGTKKELVARLEAAVDSKESDAKKGKDSAAAEKKPRKKKSVA